MSKEEFVSAMMKDQNKRKIEKKKKYEQEIISFKSDVRLKEYKRR